MSIGSINYTNSLKTSFLKRYDLDGSVWIEAIAHTDLVAKTPYRVTVNKQGHITVDMVSDIVYYYVGVPAKNCLEGGKAWLQVGGLCSDVITPELSVDEDDIFLAGSLGVTYTTGPYVGQTGAFAICTEDSVDSTVQQMLLIPEQVPFTGG
jgi:hypothetical protein